MLGTIIYVAFFVKTFLLIAFFWLERHTGTYEKLYIYVNNGSYLFGLYPFIMINMDRVEIGLWIGVQVNLFVIQRGKGIISVDLHS